MTDKRSILVYQFRTGDLIENEQEAFQKCFDLPCEKFIFIDALTEGVFEGNSSGSEPTASIGDCRPSQGSSFCFMRI